MSGNSEVVFSHKRVNTGRVSVILPRDIDLDNTNQVIWALSTRLRPDRGVEFGDDGRIVFDTTHDGRIVFRHYTIGGRASITFVTSRSNRKNWRKSEWAMTDDS